MATLAAAPMIEQLPRLESGSLRVDHTRCLRVRNRNTSCDRCARACNSGCIALEEDGIMVDAARCIGCGTCSAVCPASAIEALGPDDGALLEGVLAACAQRGQDAVFACERALEDVPGDGASAAQVTPLVCLSRVDESLMLSLLADGARKVTLVRGSCEGCPEANCIETARAMVDSANALLAAWGRPAAVTIASELPSGCHKAASSGGEARGPQTQPQPSHSERAAAESQPVGPRAYPKVDRRRRTLPQYLPPHHERVLEALGQLGDPVEPTVESRLWKSVSIDAEKCVSCQMCATFCTTGAIRRLPSKDGFGVEHTPALCVGCGCCEDICPAGALSLLDKVSTADLAYRKKYRFDMEPVVHPSGTPHGIAWRMRELLNSNLVADF